VSKKPLWTDEHFAEFKKEHISSLQQRLQNNQSLNFMPSNAGPLHTEVQEPIVNFHAAPSQLEINSQNASIIFGSDRPGGLASGYGAAGAQGSNTIDIVVGRMAGANKGAGPPDGAVVEPSFGADAARIYISQRTDIDKNFGLIEGRIGSIKGHSAIGIKADGVRIIGREGVKIVTGRSYAFGGMGSTGETNAMGGTPEVCPPIELIAGNSDGEENIPGIPFIMAGETIKHLQGVARGENTRDAIKELADLVEEVIGALFNFVLIQATFNSVLGVTPIPWHANAAPTANTQLVSKVQAALWHTRINKVMWDLNHMQPQGYKYICSKNVYST
jgi:hypothetical protein